MESIQRRVQQDLGAQFQAARVVHAKYLDGSAPDRSDANDAHGFEGKVVGPSITPWMKEGRDLPGRGADSCQVWPLMQIAAVACEREIIDVIGAAVLLRHDVLDMMLQVAVCLAQTAILASFAGPAPDEFPRRCVQLY